MTEVTIEIDSRAARALLDLAPERVNRALRAGMEDSTVLLLREMQTYPPQRAGSSYVRTNVLRGSWSRDPIEQRQNRITGIVRSNANTAPYNRLVQDATVQARVHRGRWTNTAQNVRRRTEKTIQNYFDRRLREEFSR